jgi:hypothetical protein
MSPLWDKEYVREVPGAKRLVERRKREGKVVVKKAAAGK